jgi:sodium transport system permease protein
MFQWTDVRLLYWRELRSALRERNIVVNSILLPIFLYPLLLWLVYTGISFVGGQTEGFGSRVMLKDLPTQHQQLKTDLERDKRFALRNSPRPLDDIRDDRLDVFVEFLPPPAEAAGLPGNFRARVTYDNSKDRSGIAQSRIAEKLQRYRERFLETEAGKLGVSPSQLQQFWVETRNVATSRQMGQFLLGLMLPMFLVIMLAVGCMYPAIDSTAGEREKSTWETLMTVATPRRNIVIAKYLYVATMASIAGALNICAMLFSMKAVMAPLLGDRGEALTFQIPLAAVPLALIVTVLLALFVAAGMMILASFARTFKEGQSLVSPFYIAIFLPVMFLNVPGLEFTPILALIPVVNVAMVFREAVAGVFHWPLIALTIAVEVACIALALWLATVVLRYEDFLLGSYGGNFSKFLKQRVFGASKRQRGAL